MALFRLKQTLALKQRLSQSKSCHTFLCRIAGHQRRHNQNLNRFTFNSFNSRLLFTNSCLLRFYYKNTNNNKTETMADEVSAAQTALPSEDTIFGKIARGDIPTKFLHQDHLCVAFNDISPTAPTHFLVIPRKPITGLSAVKEEDKQILGHLMFVASKVAEEQGLGDGYRVVVNNGRNGCQSVYHLHLHVIGGRQLGWPPG